MPISLDGPLDPTHPEADALLAGLQGNILSSHGRKHAWHLFLNFGTPASQDEASAGRARAKRLIARLVADATITSAKAQTSQQPNDDFATLLLSAAGYEFLDAKRPKDGAFRDGMRSRAAKLDDPPVNDWESAYQVPRRRIHALLVLANDDPVRLEAFRVRVAGTVASEGGTILIGERGDQLFRDGLPIEHFGYADGLSQPKFFKSPPSGSVAFDQHTKLKRVLEEDRAAPGHFGSFLVYRKLEQNVRSFDQAVNRVAAELGLDADLVGAMVIGRFKNGTPIAKFSAPKPGFDPKSADGDFTYQGDADGNKTPLAAHIRKTNPRGSLGALANALAKERTRRIARRGITYGSRPDGFGANGPVPTGGVGLLFMCYQADIADQFEFMQTRWANSSTFPTVATAVGRDGVIGQRGSSDAVRLKLPTAWGSGGRRGVAFGEHVRLQGGEYFYAPSIPGLEKLSAT